MDWVRGQDPSLYAHDMTRREIQARIEESMGEDLTAADAEHVVYCNAKSGPAVNHWNLY